jgi:SAM-dependent methyltransferase
VGVGHPAVESVVTPDGARFACRFCAAPLTRSFADLGSSPLANSYLEPDDLGAPETFFPLHAFVCDACLLVQLPEVASPADIFTEYAYFSSFSDTWLAHARAYVEAAIARFGLDGKHLVVELASNDGYLLQYFVEHGVRVLGVEPAENVARVAVEKGIPTVTEFFGTGTARRLAANGHAADLLVANNVFAHVPALNDFAEGIRRILKPGGVATLEFPHLLELVSRTEFDTIYHEHFSYFSFTTAERVLGAHDLAVFDVERLPTHGGSLRLYSAPASERRPVGDRVEELRALEAEAGLLDLATYDGFQERVRASKRDLLEFLLDAKRRGLSVAGYGAAAKATTLLNYCGIRSDFLDYVVDRSPYKHGRFLPGTHLPIHPPERLAETRPDLLLILAWNLKDEVMEQMAHVRDWGCRFVTPIPLEVHE